METQQKTIKVFAIVQETRTVEIELPVTTPMADISKIIIESKEGKIVNVKITDLKLN